VLLATTAAAFFGAQAVLARRSMRHVDAQTGAMITIVTATTVFWMLGAFRFQADWWRSPAVWVFVVNGFVHPTVSMFLSFEANRRMGATVSAAIAGTTPLFAAAGAVLGLGEHVTPQILLGTLGTVAGIIVLSWARGGRKEWAHSALFFPLGAAAVRAFNQVWTRFGLSLLPLPLFAATVSFSVASLASVAGYRATHGRLPLRLPLAGVAWAALGGLTVVVAILCMFSALNLGAVVVVSPVVSAYPLFTLFWSLLFRQETLHTRILVGVALVVGGVILISLR
jgi:drug/metabolite transporter (DMT)-like permease